MYTFHVVVFLPVILQVMYSNVYACIATVILVCTALAPCTSLPFQ